ncbi:MAG: hypothetical protein P1V97_16820, partial [Planctomycetota bacterium]|nr:hypothetical protein [Planctomycetota bacterium]
MSWARLFLIVFVLAATGCASQRTHADSIEANPKETVVLIHGLGGSPWTLSTLEGSLEEDGYRAVSFAYSAREESLEEISARFKSFIEKSVKSPRYHLVGFSLGNVVIRDAMKKGLPKGLARAVMIAPPNKAVGLAKSFKNCCLYSWIAGESGQKLADPAFYKDLPIPNVEFGVIAGDCGTCLSYDEANDGIVPVKATKLEGMKD